MSRGRELARRILDADAVRELDEALIATYASRRALCAEYPAAQRIPRPPIPAIFSESLVALAAPQLFGLGARATFGGSAADLRVTLPSGRSLLVEVKATGTHAWQEIKARDLARDVFVWVAFGTRYERGSGAIDIYILRDPAQYSPPRRKLTLPVFLTDAQRLDGFDGWRFETINDMLTAASPSLLTGAPSTANGGIRLEIGRSCELFGLTPPDE